MKIVISVLIIITICLNAQTLSAQNAPISAIGIAETYNDSATVSITVTDFINIGACDLLITYDSTIASATLVSLGPGVGAYYFIGNYKSSHHTTSFFCKYHNCFIFTIFIFFECRCNYSSLY